MPTNNFAALVERRLRWSGFLALVIGAIVTLAGRSPAAAPENDSCPIQMTNVTEATGITFRHTDCSSGRRYIVETLTAGVALFDYDGDGAVDIYFLNGAPTPGYHAEKIPRNALYRNDGNWHFTDVTDQAGVGDTGFGLGVAVADYNNDGALDLYVNNFGPNVLYQNNGDGTFRDVIASAGVGAGNLTGAGACFLDIDGDGDADLYCANYIDFTYQNHVQPMVAGFPRYAGPKDFKAVPDTLFRNNGDGTFTDISDSSGIGRHAGTGMGMVCLDYDNDGDTDVAVLNDVSGNFLFQNDGTGHFQEVGLLSGIAFNVDGTELGSMGFDCADYDNDGWIDLFQTAYAKELPALYHNCGGAFFEDVTRAAGAGVYTYPHVNWGVNFADFDNDGDRDLFIANGHLQDNVQLYDGSTSFAVRNTLLMNTGDGKFQDVSRVCGNGLSVKKSSRGSAVDDLDRDGDVDLVVLNSRESPTVLRNDSETGHHWIGIRLVGTRATRDGVGAHVRVFVGDRVQLDEVHSGRGYQSHCGLQLHFGLGNHDHVDRIEVRWIGGGRETFHGTPIDQVVTLIEGHGTAAPAP